MKLVIEESPDGKVVDITIYEGNEKLIEEILARIGFTKKYKRGSIKLQVTTF